MTFSASLCVIKRKIIVTTHLSQADTYAEIFAYLDQNVKSTNKQGVFSLKNRLKYLTNANRAATNDSLLSINLLILIK